MTLRKLREILHAELRHTRDELGRHQTGCADARGQCFAEQRFQERIRTLNFALDQAGGRKLDDAYQWGPVEGA